MRCRRQFLHVFVSGAPLRDPRLSLLPKAARAVRKEPRVWVKPQLLVIGKVAPNMAYADTRRSAECSWPLGSFCSWAFVISVSSGVHGDGGEAGHAALLARLPHIQNLKQLHPIMTRWLSKADGGACGSAGRVAMNMACPSMALNMSLALVIPQPPGVN